MEKALKSSETSINIKTFSPDLFLDRFADVGKTFGWDGYNERRNPMKADLKDCIVHYCLGRDCNNFKLRGVVFWFEDNEPDRVHREMTTVMDYCPHHRPSDLPFGLYPRETVSQVYPFTRPLGEASA